MNISQHNTALYLHIPFCNTKCTYCAFNTYTNLEALIQPFTLALTHELEIIGTSKPALPIATVFFGGGTPSLLLPEQIERILQTIRRVFTLLPDAEISLEANPNDLIESEYPAALRALGINRLSIGMQSASARELMLFARRHDFDQVVTAVANARAGGFDNVNLDLIYGIPQQTLAVWRDTLTQALELTPEHISLYALGLEEGTPLERWVVSGRLPSPDDDLAVDMYDVATEMLAARGYQQYEISNWSLSGRQCLHNLFYWRNLEYLGVGPGAHGHAGGVRYASVLSPQRYIKALLADERPYPYPLTPTTENPVTLSVQDVISDTLIMGLRLTQEGIRRAVFQGRFGADVLDVHGDVLKHHAARGLLEITDDMVRLTPSGRMLSNLIFRDLV